ncbi:MAG TPA: DJ-1/PfpI family protein [Candidatus Babeliales bacterium]|nr:DJ-1/PfpI family protein [Candidatus Babeliales bacterium]
MANEKVLLMIAGQEFQPIEYGHTKKVLEDNNIEVVTGSDASGQAYATDGSVAHVNVVIPEIDMDLFDGIFLIGGAGAMKYLDTGDMYNLLRKAEREGKAYGAICISPRILARAGVLTGKKATGWDEDEKLKELFQKHDVNYVQEPVVIDGKVITARGPKQAEEFGKAIVNVIK